MKGETLPTKLEEGVLYYAESDNKIVVKTTPKGYVDLGLPSGTLWAKCNLGATKEEESGYFFQWGETEGHDLNRTGGTLDKSYNWDTAPFNNNSSTYDEAYFTANSGTWLTEKAELKNEYDAAYQATDGVAHMPTEADFKELTANTTVTWVTDYNGSGINGRKFTASNGNYIFIPASGYAYDGSVGSRGASGNVWSSSLYSSNPYLAWLLGFDSSGVGVGNDYRYGGRSVRGVVSK